MNSGRIQINLKDREDRSKDALAIMARLQPQLAQINGIDCYLQPLQDLTVEDRVSRTEFQYSIEDANQNELNDWTNRMLVEFRKLPELRNVVSDQQIHGLDAHLVIDRDNASRLGVTPQNIDDTLDDAFGQRQVSTIFTQLNQYHVVLEVKPDFALNTDALNNIYVASSQGKEVPLSSSHSL